jgi:hypothetical protein
MGMAPGQKGNIQRSTFDIQRPMIMPERGLNPRRSAAVSALNVEG